jgi:hypothetical protein
VSRDEVMSPANLSQAGPREHSSSSATRIHGGRNPAPSAAATSPSATPAWLTAGEERRPSLAPIFRRCIADKLPIASRPDCDVRARPAPASRPPPNRAGAPVPSAPGVMLLQGEEPVQAVAAAVEQERRELAQLPRSENLERREWGAGRC